MTSITTAPALPQPTRPVGLVLPAASLWKREMIRFFRDRNRVVSSMVTPIIFWLFLGLGLSATFHMPSETPAVQPEIQNPKSEMVSSSPSYLQYFFPGTVVFILLSTAVFSTISVIEDRREGFMQGVLVAPVSRLSIVMGKVLGGASIATLQACVFLLIWPFIAGSSTGGIDGWTFEIGHMLFSVLVMFMLAVSLTAMGLCLAWSMDSTSGFHAVMMVFLMPMWFLSGAVFPATGAPFWLKMAMLANPLSYGQEAFTRALTGGGGSTGLGIGLLPALAVTMVTLAGELALASRIVSRPRKDGLA